MKENEMNEIEINGQIYIKKDCTMLNVLEQVLERMSNLEQFLKSEFIKKDAPTENEFLNVEETAEYLGLAKPTVYDLVFKKQLPNCKQGKRLYFIKSDLENWVLNSRREVKPK